jgi:hypothetical protein
LDYYGARYYNPKTMRWTQPDTTIPEVYNPQSLNRYAYCVNNPMLLVDPKGNTYIPGLTELREHLDSFVEQHLPGLAQHNEVMRQQLSSDPSKLWNAGSFNVGSVNVKPGAIAESIYKDPAGTLLKIGNGALMAYSLGGISESLGLSSGGSLGEGGTATVENVNTITTESDALNAGETVIKTSGGDELTVTENATQRMAERDFTQQDVVNTMETGDKFSYYHNGAWKTGWYNSETKTFVGSLEGEMKTIFRTSLKYIENLKSKTP